LKKQGFAVSLSPDGEDALDKIRKDSYALVILDLMLPGLQGIEVCRILRQDPRTESLPVLILTARSDVADKVRGLENGADDYLTKPFSPQELIARVRSILRRAGADTARDRVIRLGDLQIDKETYQVTRQNRTIRLGATEFRLLLFLAERRGRVFSRDQLLDAVWKDESLVEPRTVDVHIRRLRTAVEDDPSDPCHIMTRRGVGYYVE
jgi:DNA-binding response OmpR family regulator